MAVRAEEDAWSVATGSKPGSFSRSLFSFLSEQAVVLDLDPADLLDADPVSDERPYSRTRARTQTPDGDPAEEELALGAPEAVLEMCSGLSAAELDTWHDLVESGAKAGERLLLLARCLEGGQWLPLGVLAFADRIRPGIREAMVLAIAAGIQPMVVTGDHPTTAAAIAADAGLPNQRVVTGPELATWDDDRLAAELPTLNIVARAIPEQKLRIVDVARRSNRTVAVTGDGVNDAPALHHADVAVAMGSGTAVAREASDLVLGDDSFVTLMDGLREGRRLVANVQKGLVFLVSTHVAMLGFILIATIAGFDQPLLPIQILWLEIFIDMLTAVSFEGEAEEPGAMQPSAAAAHRADSELGNPWPHLPGRRLQRLRRALPDRAAQRRLRARQMAGLHRAGRGPGGSCQCQPQPRLPGAAAPPQHDAAAGRRPMRRHPGRHPLRAGPC